MTEQQFDEITEWQKKVFPKATPMSKLIHLAGKPQQDCEIKELMEAIDAEEDCGTVYAEFADCFFLLFGAAAAIGMDYEDICNAIEDKFKINKQRKWGNPDKDGVVNHIK